jgi:D-arabinono-1,4-lactone oxidase
LNDLVRAIEYVDFKGVHQKITDKAQLAAAAGCFGLLGLVTHVTYELSPMSYAVMKPAKIPTCLAIPHPKGPQPENIPEALRRDYTPKDWDDALENFEERCDKDYYAEFFWFAYQSTCWVNTWDTSPDPKGSREYTTPAETFLQWLQTWLGGVITSTELYKAIPGRWQAQLLASVTMAAFPPTTFENKDTTIKTMLPNALHFRRDDQNMRVRDMEFEIPIPALEGTTDKPDWKVVRRAWWDVIELVYSEVDSPLRLCMELRIMRDSDVLMAPQRGNGALGTASIEVLTLPDAVTDDEWSTFVQKVCDKWMGTEGNHLNGNVRPHWGKEWSVNGMKMRGLDPKVYLRDQAYKDQIPEFKEILGQIGQQQGWTLDDLQKRFSNNVWDVVIFG